MAKSLDMGNSGNSIKAHAEKPTFNQTCNLLSQFMKEKRLAMDSSKGLPVKLEHKAKTMNLLTSMENSDDASIAIAAVMKSLPQFLQNSTNSNESDYSRGKDQLTIFYSGKVLVFNNFAAENATEVMEMATKLSSNTSTMEKAQTRTSPVPSEITKMAVPAINIADQQCPPPAEPQSSGSNLKIARRASLHKFFEKRKERVTARGPYPLNNPMIASASASKPTDESSSGASDDDHHDHIHGQSSKELDLTL